MADRPSILHEQAMVEAGYVSTRSEVEDVGGPVQACAASVRELIGCCFAIGDAGRTQRGGRTVTSLTHEELHIGLIVALQNIILQAVELVSKLEVVGAPQSALEPCHICIELNGF